MKKDRNILIISQLFPPDMGGGATRAFNAAKGLTSNGCRVTIISAFPHYPEGKIPTEYRLKPLKVVKVDNLRVIRTFVFPLQSKGLIRRALLFSSFIVSSLFALPLVGKADIVWAANPNVIAAHIANIFGFFKRCPVGVNVDDLWPEDLDFIKEGSLVYKVVEDLARKAYSKASIITPISKGYIKIISEKYSVPLEKICLIPAGVDTEKFNPAFGNPNGRKEFTVLYSGAFSLAYDFNQILNAAETLKDKTTGIRIIIQGGGERAAEIGLRIKELGLKNVTFIQKIVSRDSVVELLKNTDALILPLRDFGKPYTGLSSKLFEYQAIGKPIICCAEGQPADYVKETKSGIIVHPGNYRALADSIIFLKENPQIALYYGKNGRRYVEENMSLITVGCKFKEAFYRLNGKNIRTGKPSIVLDTNSASRRQ